jgi:Gpi18-like mannosyltransferase
MDDWEHDWADEITEEQPEVGRPGWRRLLGHAPWVLVLYLFTRLIQLMILSWLSPPDTKLRDRLLAWDGGWWVRVATEGYPHGYTYDDQGQLVGNALAFFPLYPSLIKLLDYTGLSAGTSALVIAWVAGAAVALLAYQLGTVLSGGNARVGFALAALVCTQPMSLVLSMGYSESLFLALVLAAMLACWYDQWLLAGILACAAGLTRPTGAAVALAVLAGAVAAVVRRRTHWTALIGAFIGLLGVPMYLVWVGARVGHLNAWFQIQTAGWGTTTDYGKSTWQFVKTAIHQGDGWVQVSVALLLIAAAASVVLAVVRRTWLPLAVYGVIDFGLVVGQAGYYHSKPRLLLTVVLTLIPAAFAAARARTPVAVVALTTYALFGMWYGAYMLAVWHYTI